MKIIFLDIDGVVLTFESTRAASKEIRKRHQGGEVPFLERCELRADARCVEALNQLIKATDAKVVVSSAWRSGQSVSSLQAILDAFGLHCEVIGKTADPSGELVNGIYTSVSRGVEIGNWLQAHAKDAGVSAYIVIDDERIEEHRQRQVKTRYHKGLQGFRKVHLTRAMEILEVPYAPE